MNEGAEAKRAALERRLGNSWRARSAPRVLQRRVSLVDGFQREDLLLDLGGGEGIPAILTRPLSIAGPIPSVLYCHAHGNRYETGCIELTEGRPALQQPAYAAPLAALCMAALSLDMPCFGGRRRETESARAKRLLWRGGTLFGEMLSDLAGGLDFLAMRDDIDAQRVGALGLSMGATLAFWLAALDGRVRALAQLCVLADLDSLIEADAHDLHGHYMTVPGLLPGFPAGEIAGLAAPRPQFVGLGALDPLTPEPARSLSLEQLRLAYEKEGGGEQLTVHLEHGSGHAETVGMRRAVLEFFGKALNGTPTDKPINGSAVSG